MPGVRLHLNRWLNWADLVENVEREAYELFITRRMQ